MVTIMMMITEPQDDTEFLDKRKKYVPQLHFFMDRHKTYL